MEDPLKELSNHLPNNHPMCGADFLLSRSGRSDSRKSDPRKSDSRKLNPENLNPENLNPENLNPELVWKLSKDWSFKVLTKTFIDFILFDPSSFYP